MPRRLLEGGGALAAKVVSACGIDALRGDGLGVVRAFRTILEEAELAGAADTDVDVEGAFVAGDDILFQARVVT